ncbi:MAG: hypothetical protein ACYCV7_12630 [Acidimicrobiales bacterium]
MGIKNRLSHGPPGDGAPSDDSLLHDEEIGTTRTSSSRPQRPQESRADARPATSQLDRSTVPTKWAIDRLDGKEKRFSLAAAGGAALFGVAIYLSETHNRNFRLAKGQLTPQTTLMVGLIAAVLLIATTMLGRRAPVGFVALFTGAAFGGTFLFLGLPFFALAVWVLYRSYKVQKQTAGAMRAAGGTPGHRAPSGQSSTSARSHSSAHPPASSNGRNRRSKGPAGPTANKRYTPKRPPPPKPKPSRRERKATASD